MPSIRKSFGRLVTSQTKDLGHGVVSVIVSTSNKDRHGEIVDIKGLDTKQYSGVVLLNHDYEQLPIGKSLGLKKTADGKLISKTQFAVDEFPLAKTVYDLVKGGYMTDVSIGFIPKQFDPETNTWVKSEMIEYSHVAIGANPEAKVMKALGDMGLSKDDFQQQVKDHMAQMKSFIDPEDKTNTPAPVPEHTEDVETDEAETKGAVADELNAKDKWDYLRNFWEVIYAFEDAYFRNDTPATDFGKLLKETIGILETEANGTYKTPEDDDPVFAGVVGLAVKAGVAPLQRAELDAQRAKHLDTPANPADNELQYIATLKRLITLAETELKQLPTEKDEEPSRELRHKRVIVLQKTRENINNIDRLAETISLGIKRRMSEERLQNND